jgi:hypothetical protein
VFDVERASSKDVHEVEAALLHVVDAELDEIAVVDEPQHRRDFGFSDSPRMRRASTISHGWVSS